MQVSLNRSSLERRYWYMYSYRLKSGSFITSSRSLKITFLISAGRGVDVSKNIESLCMESDQENLKNIIHERDQSIKEYQKKVKTLKTKNKSLENDSYTVDDFEKKIKEQIDTLGESIKTSILQEI
eukprot:TCONS_00037684-protein